MLLLAEISDKVATGVVIYCQYIEEERFHIIVQSLQEEYSVYRLESEWEYSRQIIVTYIHHDFFIFNMDKVQNWDTGCLPLASWYGLVAIITPLQWIDDLLILARGRQNVDYIYTLWSRKSLARRHRFWQYILLIFPSTSKTESESLR